MLVIGVFGGNNVPRNVADFSEELGAALIANPQWLPLSGGDQPCGRGVKNRVLCGAHDQATPAWIGVTQDRTPYQDPVQEEEPPGLVLRTNLGHKRNYVEAHLVDAAIALPGGDGTVSEVVATLCLAKPVVLVGDWTGSPIENDIDIIAAGHPLDDATRERWVMIARRRIGRAPQGAAQEMVAELIERDIQAGALAAPQMLTAYVEQLNTESVVHTLDALMEDRPPTHDFPMVRGYAALQAAFDEYVTPPHRNAG